MCPNPHAGAYLPGAIPGRDVPAFLGFFRPDVLGPSYQPTPHTPLQLSLAKVFAITFRSFDLLLSKSLFKIEVFQTGAQLFISVGPPYIL